MFFAITIEIQKVIYYINYSNREKLVFNIKGDLLCQWKQII